jgi:hypothetical protein
MNNALSKSPYWLFVGVLAVRLSARPPAWSLGDQGSTGATAPRIEPTGGTGSVSRTTAQIARWQNLSFPSSLQRFSITRLQDDFHQVNKDQDLSVK